MIIVNEPRDMQQLIDNENLVIARVWLPRNKRGEVVSGKVAARSSGDVGHVSLQVFKNGIQELYVSLWPSDGQPKPLLVYFEVRDGRFTTPEWDNGKSVDLCFPLIGVDGDNVKVIADSYYSKEKYSIPFQLFPLTETANNCSSLVFECLTAALEPSLRANPEVCEHLNQMSNKGRFLDPKDLGDFFKVLNRIENQVFSNAEGIKKRFFKVTRGEFETLADQLNVDEIKAKKVYFPELYENCAGEINGWIMKKKLKVRKHFKELVRNFNVEKMKQLREKYSSVYILFFQECVESTMKKNINKLLGEEDKLDRDIDLSRAYESAKLLIDHLRNKFSHYFRSENISQYAPESYVIKVIELIKSGMLIEFIRVNKKHEIQLDEIVWEILAYLNSNRLLLALKKHPDIAGELMKKIQSERYKVNDTDFRGRMSSDDKQSGGYDLQKLAILINTSIERAERAFDKGLVLFFGVTGVGKSTLINHLMGARLVRKRLSDVPKKCIVVDEGEEVYAEIGHNPESYTLHPTIVPMREHPESMAYCDLPGSEDNRVGEEKLCSEITLPIVISRSKGVKGIVVLIRISDFDDPRYTDYNRTLNSLCDIVGDENEFDLEKRVIFLFVKSDHTQQVKIEKIKKYIDFFHKNLNKKLEGLKDTIGKLSAEIVELNARTSEEHDVHSVSPEKISEITAKSAHHERKLSELNSQLNYIKSQYDHEYNKYRVSEFISRSQFKYVLDYDSPYQRDLIIEVISSWSNLKAIDKSKFLSRNTKSLSELDKALEDIAADGLTVLNDKNSIPEKITSMKKVKRSLNDFKSKNAFYLEQLSTDKTIDPVDIDNIKKEYLKDIERISKLIESQEMEKRDQLVALEQELARLDVGDEEKYDVRELSPVTLKLYSLKAMLATVVPLAIVTLPVGIIGGVISSVALWVVQAAQKINRNITSEDKAKAYLFPILYPYFKPLLGSLNLFSRSHTFVYEGIPFLRAELQTNPPFLKKSIEDEFDEPIIEIDEESGIAELAINMIEDFVAKNLRFISYGIDNNSKVIDAEAGKIYLKYSSPGLRTFPDSDRKEESEDKETGGRKSSTMRVWVDLYVEKRLIPENRIRIQQLRNEINLVNFSLSNWMKPTLFKLRQAYGSDLEFFKDKTGDDLRNALLSRLEKMINICGAELKKPMEMIYGLESDLNRAIKKLERNFLQYSVVRVLYSALGRRSGLVEEFLSKMDNQVTLPAKQKPHWYRFHSKTNQPKNYQPIAEVTEPLSVLKPEGLNLNSLSTLNAVLSKIAHRIYLHCSDGAYRVCTMKLAEPSLCWSLGIFNNVNLLVKMRPEYMQLDALQLVNSTDSLMNLLSEGQSPTHVMLKNVSGRLALEGIFELLAVGRILGDSNMFSRDFSGVRCVVERNEITQPNAVRVIKVNFSETFNFDVIPATKDIVYANNRPPLSWDSLSDWQKEKFCAALIKARELLFATPITLNELFALEAAPSGKAIPLDQLDIWKEKLRSSIDNVFKTYEDDIEHYQNKLLRLSPSRI